ncbi:MAG: hypothetical protein WAW36_18915 [Methylovulum miyakonense]|uniref:DUF7210 family protein n=1 Tax=Methylovulum miyakonense TaxID=645578 RepID=UPI003BB5CDFE
MSTDNPEGGEAPANEKAPRKKDGNVQVIIAVDTHSHAGQPVSKGDKITVTPAERDWLSEHQLIEV